MLVVLLASAVIAVFVLAAGCGIRSPGLYYDEVLFVNAATGGASDSFVHSRIAGVPIMVMPYIGALKAWLHVPVFAAFGVSPETIRWPSVLLAAGALAIGFLTVRLWLGGVPALAFTVLCAVSPGFVAQSRLDWGPVVLMMVLKACVLYVVALHLRAPRLGLLVAAGVLAGLGVWDKLNFVWFLVALAIAVPAAWPLASWRAVRHVRGAGIWLLCVGGALLAVGALVILPQSPSLDLAAAAARAPLAHDAVRSAFDGAAVGALVFDRPFDGSPAWELLLRAIPAASLVLLVAVVALTGARTVAAWMEVRVLLFALVMSGAIVAQILATPQAGGPHHYLMVFPYPQLALVALGTTVHRLPRAWVRGVGVALATGLAVLVASEAAATWRFRAVFADDAARSPRWSEAIYQLPDVLARLEPSPQRIVFTDWGLFNQVYALGDPSLRGRLMDLWPLFNDMTREEPLPEDVVDHPTLGPRPIALVSFSRERSTFPATYENLGRWVAAQESVAARQVLSDSKGVAMYEIHLVPD